MNHEDILQNIVKCNNSKIVLIVLDGVGDIRNRDYNYKTPLEYAKTPNLDKLASESVVGRMIPVSLGITPGSGPGHIGLFGYDPTKITIGRGVLEAVGLGLNLHDGDVAARCNFATISADGKIIDRRARRIPTEKTIELCNILKSIKSIDGVEIIIEPGEGHRFVTIFRSRDKEIDSLIDDTDPQVEGKPPLKAKGHNEASIFLASVVNKFIKKGFELLSSYPSTNGFLTRGFSKKPDILSMRKKYCLESAAIAAYPMYRGIASLLGMKLLSAPNSIEGLFETYIENKQKYDFFFIHVKGTDQAGEDGNFESKVNCIEKVDRALNTLLKNRPDVIAITGDHSSPCSMRSHSFHPVPVLLNSQFSGRDDVVCFHENACNVGGLGFFKSKYLMTLLLANAKRLNKFGA
ncbi:2,3-bisphosphoglycerate-independent phosphoglycerate mutase [Paramaledivibacter caminithermalis]|uniref:2,3-bisphosphoglycerate-independent phosphoglycerate mutase n=1 Tax=Paramaledivibacter caminithermalis (strain DSM 15212 / CIP 107654 / DViRD3) TaxID=1121301 RepID=A0A1M6QD71_PARC5|nr:2,3-bisphosphoglycerate-independent phosphoglycerate mutase [Paramaledivibacter caminithermalis]SHK18138.1 2,3-bisphosphoglycerate-independent phosphoglycerate mutase [Paramaledivibacter caminithermalis DSM 15212]